MTNLTEDRRRFIEGKVVSNSMDKTAVIMVESKKTQPKFGKIIKITRKIKVHDQENQLQVGDKIRAVETRPLSKDKRYKLIKVIERAS